MFSRRSRSAVLEQDIAQAGSRAADTIGELAEHAISLAREAGQAARPTVQHGAEGLSRAFERAAGAFADTAEHFTGSGDRVSEASHTARTRLADASERFAKAIRPQKSTHRIRRLLIGVAIVGGIVVLVQSPLRSKIQERIFGAPPGEEDLPPITLPNDQTASTASSYSPPRDEAEPSTDVYGSATRADEESPSPAVDTARN